MDILSVDLQTKSLDDQKGYDSDTEIVTLANDDDEPNNSYSS